MSEIRFERDGCFGTCPIFDVVFRSDNSADYLGIGYVSHLGQFTGAVDFKKLATWLASQSVYEFKDKYRTYVTDQDGARLTIVGKQSKKTIDMYDTSALPHKLRTVLSGLDGAIAKIAWQPSSGLNAYLGDFVDDSRRDRFASFGLAQTERGIIANGDAQVWTPERCSPSGVHQIADVGLIASLNKGKLVVTDDSKPRHNMNATTTDQGISLELDGVRYIFHRSTHEGSDQAWDHFATLHDGLMKHVVPADCPTQKPLTCPSPMPTHCANR
jgi:hypothetical protein